MGAGGFGIPGPGGTATRDDDREDRSDPPGDKDCKHEWEKCSSGTKTYRCKKCGQVAVEQ